MQDYRKLKVWQKSHSLALEVYAAAASLQSRPAWPLQTQILRAAISIPSNIAEGAGDRPTATSADSSCTPWARSTKLSMICFLDEISGSCQNSPIPGSRTR